MNIKRSFNAPQNNLAPVEPPGARWLLAESLRVRLMIGWLTATVSSIVGLYTSFRFDLPTGAAIVCALGAALLLTAVGAGFFRKTILASRLR